MSPYVTTLAGHRVSLQHNHDKHLQDKRNSTPATAAPQPASRTIGTETGPQQGCGPGFGGCRGAPPAPDLWRILLFVHWKNASARTYERRSEKASLPAIASMTVKRPLRDATDQTTLKYLQWNMDHSILRNVGYYWACWLRVQQPGDYYVYARVSFSRGGGPDLPLVSMVRLKHNETDKIQDVMKAYCSMGDLKTGQCTASQGQVLSLQVGNLLSVWVENLKWVDYEKGATTFGMYKL
ncbi:unnamed protein product [Lota lota]